MTLKMTDPQRREIGTYVSLLNIELDTVPLRVLGNMTENVLENMDTICRSSSKYDNDPEFASFRPHKSNLEHGGQFYFWNFGKFEDSELINIVKKSGAEVDLGCEMKTGKDNERVRDKGRVTALFESEKFDGQALVDIDFRKRKKVPEITVAWKQQYKDNIPREIFHDILTEFGIHAPSWNQQCILLEDERVEGKPWGATSSYVAKCYGSGKDIF